MTVPIWLQDLEKWEQSTYDGIKGLPPYWENIPEPNKKKFYTARFQIFNAVNDKVADYQEIKSRFDALVANNRHGIVLALMKDTKYYDNALSVLVELFKAVSLSEIECLRLLGGDLAGMGKRKSISTSRNASKPRPKKNDNGETLDNVIKTLKRSYPDEKPSAIWVHLKTAIKEWSDNDCKESGEKDSRTYYYKIGEERGSIAYGTFRKKLNE
jgi:hypothetical protein